MFSMTAPPSSCDHARICAAIARPYSSLRATTSAGNPAAASARNFASRATMARWPVGPVLEKKLCTADAIAALTHDAVVVGFARSARRHCLQAVQLIRQGLQFLGSARYSFESRHPDIGKRPAGHGRRIGWGVSHQFEDQCVPAEQKLLRFHRTGLRYRYIERGEGRHRDDYRYRNHFPEGFHHSHNR